MLVFVFNDLKRVHIKVLITYFQALSSLAQNRTGIKSLGNFYSIR